MPDRQAEVDKFNIVTEFPCLLGLSVRVILELNKNNIYNIYIFFQYYRGIYPLDSKYPGINEQREGRVAREGERKGWE